VMKLIFVHAAQANDGRQIDCLKVPSRLATLPFDPSPRIVPESTSDAMQRECKTPNTIAMLPKYLTPQSRHSALCCSLALSSIASLLESPSGQHQTATWLQGSYGERGLLVHSFNLLGIRPFFCHLILSPRSSRLKRYPLMTAILSMIIPLQITCCLGRSLLGTCQSPYLKRRRLLAHWGGHRANATH